MCNKQGENIARVIDEDGAVMIHGEFGAAFDPSARSGCVPTRETVNVSAGRLDDGSTRSDRRSRSSGVPANDERGSQAVSQYAFGIISKYPIDLHRWITPMGQHHFKALFASRKRFCTRFGALKHSCYKAGCFLHGDLDPQKIKQARRN
jgi:hypothetical protein